MRRLIGIIGLWRRDKISVRTTGGKTTKSKSANEPSDSPDMEVFRSKQNGKSS